MPTTHFISYVHYLRILIPNWVGKEHLEGKTGPHDFFLVAVPGKALILGGQDCREGEKEEMEALGPPHPFLREREGRAPAYLREQR